jgi:predicted DNA-binding protein
VTVVEESESGVKVRSLRLPREVDRRLCALAEQRQMPASTLVREWVEMELAALEDDRPISRADAIRAISRVRPSRAPEVPS